MLFDLQGRRKTAVKGIYLALAILLGGGLVLFGVGSNVNGGLADLFTNSSGDGEYKKAVENSLKQVQAKPKDVKARENLIADRFIYASSFFDDEKAEFEEDGKVQLRLLVKDWETYDKLTDDIDTTTVNSAVNAYVALEDFKGATKAQTIAADVEPNAAAYIALMQFALSAGDSRVGDAAALKAEELATPDQIEEVKANIAELRKLAKEQGEKIQQQIQEQFAAQQQNTGPGQVGNPFGGAGAPAGGAPAQ
ncbi:MAG: hypothetical protein WAP35_10740 [Solirubrobacterales bacterium]